MAFQGWNFGDLYDAVAGVVPPDRPALIHGQRIITWQEFDHRTNNLACALIAGGALPGDKLSLYIRNHSAYLEGLVAAVKCRQVPVNVNYRYVADELCYIFDNSDTSVVVFAREFAPIIDQIRKRLPKVRRWLIVEDGTAAATPDFAESFEALAADGDGRRLDIQRSPNDLFFVYTGGTTGMPKAAVWTQDAYRRAQLNPKMMPKVPQNIEEQIQIVLADQGPINLVACPLMHATGLIALSTLISGGTVVTLQLPHFDPQELWTGVAQHRVNQIVLVGDAFAKPMLRALNEAGGRYDVSCVASMISSGVTWSVEVKRGLLHHMPQVTLTDIFGASEAGGLGLSTMTAGGEVGTAKFQLNEGVKVFTPGGLEVLPGSGSAGLIAHGGPIPEGYFKDQKKTDDVFKVIGGVRYVIPGDFCTVEADGSITLLGRGSGSINTAGEKVFPEEVEEVLKLHPDVEDALVVGVHDEKWGQAVTAIVEMSNGAALNEALIRAHVRKHLAGYKTPKRLIQVTRMFRAANGKPDYKSARNYALRELGIEA